MFAPRQEKHFLNPELYRQILPSSMTHPIHFISSQLYLINEWRVAGWGKVADTVNG